MRSMVLTCSAKTKQKKQYNTIFECTKILLANYVLKWSVEFICLNNNQWDCAWVQL